MTGLQHIAVPVQPQEDAIHCFHGPKFNNCNGYFQEGHLMYNQIQIGHENHKQKKSAMATDAVDLQDSGGNVFIVSGR